MPGHERLRAWYGRPDPLAFEYRPLSAAPGREPGQDSPVCVHQGCRKASTWRFFLGDIAEHVARLNLCEHHAVTYRQYAGRIDCTVCHNPMRVEITEPMREGSSHQGEDG